MGLHKHKISALPDALDLEEGKSETSELPLISPNRLNRELGNRKNSSNGVASSSARCGIALPCPGGWHLNRSCASCAPERV